MSVCLRCGYDLRATPAEAACPECGLAAHRSVIEHSHPDDCPPRWVAMIAAASVMLLISYVGFGLFLAWMLFGGRGFTALVLGWEWEIFSRPGGLGILYSLTALALLHAVANVLLARNDRRRASRGISRSHRWALRILPLPPILGLGVFFYTYWVHSAGWWIFQPRAESISNWLIASLVLCPPITFLRLRWLALRLSRPRLAEHVMIAALGCTASLALLIVCVFFEWSDIRRADAAFFLLMVVPCALVALFNLWATMLLFVVSQRFLKSAREARARWRAADAARVKL